MQMTIQKIKRIYKLINQKMNNIFNKTNKCSKTSLSTCYGLSLILILSVLHILIQNNTAFAHREFSTSADTNTYIYTDTPTSPMPTDTRIKTFLYDPSQILQVKFIVGYQSMIELQKDEFVEAIVFGDPVPWSVKTLGSRIFLKATEPGAKTNMWIITNKRTYILEISSNGDDDNDEKITLLLKFYYPNINTDVPPTATKIAKIALNKRAGMNIENGADAKSFIANSGPINSNYTYATKGDANSIIPISVFDNGYRTYFKFRKGINVPIISILNDDLEEIPLRTRKSGEYVYVDTVGEQLTIRKKDNSIVCIFNEKRRNEKTIAYNKSLN